MSTISVEVEGRSSGLSVGSGLGVGIFLILICLLGVTFAGGFGTRNSVGYCFANQSILFFRISEL